MRRRHLLATAGTIAAAGVSGCMDLSEEGSAGPGPSPSELTITVENTASDPRAANFVLHTTRDRTARVEGFSSGAVEPDQTWIWGPETLEAGEYELEITLPSLDMQTTPTWSGNQCLVQKLTITLQDTGFVLQTDCQAASE